MLAAALGQPAGGEPGRLMAHFAGSLAELAGWIVHAHDGRWSALPVEAGGSAARLAALLSRLPHWDDRARHPEAGEVWLYKRAQIAAADLALAGLASFGDLDRLTCMADNLIPHVLRLDGVLVVDPSVVARIDREALSRPGSRPRWRCGPWRSTPSSASPSSSLGGVSSCPPRRSTAGSGGVAGWPATRPTPGTAAAPPPTERRGPGPGAAKGPRRRVTGRRSSR